jgi:hypothetical protein
METSEAKVSLIEKVLVWMDRSPQGQRCRTEMEQQAKTKRVELITQIETLRMRHVLEMPPLKQAIEAAKAREQDAQRALLEAKAQVHQAYGAYLQEYLPVSAALDRCEAQLCSLADERITMFIREITEEFEDRRHGISSAIFLPHQKDKFTDELKVRFSSNAISVERWANRIHEVISLAKDLKLKNPDNLDQELAALRDSIPNAHASELVYTEYPIPARDK